ncbi:MAG: hypothetical protein G01um101431_559 [Parcubacteria group bacterium Gr01-1014_31]|nr:MAG: hypothetical protein G01um101431_559 [Parcubacteria group bacterium Gr01-1014_31]
MPNGGKTPEERKSLKVEILEKMGQLVTTGFGIVAALAWNDVIKKFFETIFPRPEDNLWAMFGYAMVITALIVALTYQLGRLLERAKMQLNQAKKEQGEGPLPPLS